MTKPTQTKITRRDAIKTLGALAGASVLANLPSKWSTPEVAAGELPAHAQISPASPVYAYDCWLSFNSNGSPRYPGTIPEPIRNATVYFCLQVTPVLDQQWALQVTLPGGAYGTFCVSSTSGFVSQSVNVGATLGSGSYEWRDSCSSGAIVCSGSFNVVVT